jgi:hypothetical protein
LNGLPKLGLRRASDSTPSENREHQPAKLKQQEFRIISHLKLGTGISSIWASEANARLKLWQVKWIFNNT